MNFRRCDITAIPQHSAHIRIENSRYVAEDVLNAIRTTKRTNRNPGHVEFSGMFGAICIPIKDKHVIFANSPKCVFCDVDITVACVERNGEEPWQLRFYGIKDGKLVMFTVDHRVPKSLGGPDKTQNYQSCCQPCNVKKGNICTDPFAAARIRLRGHHE